jgi:hypothetical protein
VLGDAGEHAGADLLAIVEGENHIGPSGPGKNAVGASLPLHCPADPPQGRKNTPGPPA